MVKGDDARGEGRFVAAHPSRRHPSPFAILSHQSRLAVAVVAIAAAACAQGPGGIRNGVPVLATPEHGAFPTAIGGRGIGKAAHRLAAAALVDSVLRHWGWRVAMADSATTRLQTAWLYLPRGTFHAGFGSQCDAGSFAALRLNVSASDSSTGPTDFFVRGEALFYDNATRTEAQRLVQTAFSQVGADLTAALRGADTRPDDYGPSFDRRWGPDAVKRLADPSICTPRGR